MRKLIFTIATFLLAGQVSAAPTETEMQSALNQNLDSCTNDLKSIKDKGEKFKEEARRTASRPGIQTSEDWEATITQFYQKINADKRAGVDMINDIKTASPEESTKKVAKFNEHLKNISVGCKNMMDGLKEAICHNAGLKEKVKCKLGL